MIENIKVDIVYFMTATDFEFEFNLGSCCHMRLLNDKAKDKKSFVNSLARAVSRSQIIICCGPLFGEDGLIATAAAAISHGLQTVNNAEYGISSDDKIEIIEDSLPLVTPEGYFGGCIIESGPQTIILLTENRTLRKSIMKNLIHPYIEDVSLMQSAEKIVSDAKKTEETAAETVAAAENAAPEVSVTTPEAEQEAAPEVSVTTPEAAEPEQEEEQPQPEEPAEAPEAQAPKNEEEALSPQEEVLSVSAAETAEEPDKENGRETEAATQAADEAKKDGEHNITFDFSADEEMVTDSSSAQEEQSSEDASDFNDIFIREDAPRKADEKRDGISTSILVTVVCLLLAVLAVILVLVFAPLTKGMTTGEYIKSIFGNVFISKYI